MTTKRKSLRARRSAPPLPEPSGNQIAEAMIAFERAKVRYQIGRYCHNDRYFVRVLPPMVSEVPIEARDDHQFPDEASARQWREREIIREAITVGMRARP